MDPLIRMRLIESVRRMRQQAPRGKCADVAIAEGLIEEGWILADDVDEAAELERQRRETALSAREVYAGESAIECEECGEPIPQERREAVPGCRRCVECQEAMERLQW